MRPPPARNSLNTVLPILPLAAPRLRWLSLGLCLIASLSCRRESAREVVVYAALDREFSEPILRDFERESGISAAPKFDVESTKTVGLATAILQQRRSPRCDVFWNNEILHTLRLQREGLLDAYPSPQSAALPAEFRDPAGHWHGFAARARVLLVNTEHVPADERPNSVTSLADPRWRDRCGLAKPLFGTTATHAAVLFARWGDERAEEFFRAVRANAQVLSGNKQVAVAVGRGQLSFGLTDTDDAIAEVESGSPVAIVFPDQGPDGEGTLRIPNTIAIIRNCRHSEEARKLVDYVLSAQVERELARSASAQLPLRSDVDERSRVQPANATIRWMSVDFAAAADKWDHAARWLRDEFSR